eukprot:CAMPEP_0113652058 /NCGR_PEP_ID=MMETSP0017_2-20120614/27780_1 /TAXON_ID=2856 /ORGANISM="Cylindrotheca closterium" /LENGTH=47 /DNA_ID=CAMNT_0000564833 /DNA_START=256 /DNA_END=396 /DNA_ORIENTATION=- /assembly_acc=CAM_ASM_000147
MKRTIRSIAYSLTVLMTSFNQVFALHNVDGHAEDQAFAPQDDTASVN